MRRWDGDERGKGVADARNFAPGAASLLDAMQEGTWIAEEPELHLLPHLRHACESLPFELVAARTADDGSFDVDLRRANLSETFRLAERAHASPERALRI